MSIFSDQLYFTQQECFSFSQREALPKLLFGSAMINHSANKLAIGWYMSS